MECLSYFSSDIGLREVSYPMKTVSDVPNVTRATWWITFILMGGGMYTARWVYESGLSFWLKRADLTYTAGAILIALVAFSVFVVGCVGRLKDMNSSVTAAKVLFLFPVWLILMGTVPSASSENPEPLLRFWRSAKRVLVGVGALVLVAAIVFGFATKTPSTTEGTVAEAAESTPVDNASDMPTTRECVELGINYYKDIGSYPSLSSGKDARTEVNERCRRSALAFGMP